MLLDRHSELVWSSRRNWPDRPTGRRPGPRRLSARMHDMDRSALARPKVGRGRLLRLAIDPSSPERRYRQIYGQLRRSILDGALKPGSRLPSSRALAIDLGVSRATVIQAFEQLAAEGYIRGREGAATYVSVLNHEP